MSSQTGKIESPRLLPFFIPKYPIPVKNDPSSTAGLGPFASTNNPTGIPAE